MSLPEKLLCRPRIGKALNFLFQDQLPLGRGAIAFTRSPGVSDATRASIFFGFHARARRRLIARHVRGDQDVVELGAGIGVTTAAIARRLAAGRRLVAVEADAAIAVLIAQNVAINAPATHLTVLEGALAWPDVVARAGLAAPCQVLGPHDPALERHGLSLTARDGDAAVYQWSAR